MNLGWTLLSIAVIKARILVMALECSPNSSENPNDTICLSHLRQCEKETCYFSNYPVCSSDWTQGYGSRCGWGTSQIKWCYKDNCTRCIRGFHLKDGRCNECGDIPGCEEVSCTREWNSMCTKCESGYFLSASNTCDNVIDRFDLSNFFEVRHTDGDDEYTDLHDDDDAAYSDQSQSFHLQMQIGIKLIIMCLIGLI